MTKTLALSVLLIIIIQEYKSVLIVNLDFYI